MKVGIRTPSIKKSIKAGTTGKYKRKLKRMVNPLYGKKGIGWIKNPKKAFKNKVYHKTTVSAKKAYKGVAGIFFGFFMLCWWMIKWSCLLCFYFLKYFCLFMAWTFVTLVNAIVTLVEWVINLGKEQEPFEEMTQGEIESESLSDSDLNSNSQ